MKKTGFSLLITVLFLAALPLICHADTAEVLPKGVFLFDSVYYHYFDIDERYNPDGDVENIAVDYNTDLNSSVFPALAPLDPFVPGGASIGRPDVDFTLVYRWSEFSLNYGITDRLSVGVLVPFNYSKNKVDAQLDNTNANVGKNPFYGMGILPPPLDTAALIPISFGGIPLVKEDVQDLLGKGLDVNNDGVIDYSGYEYKRIETWSDSGIGDIELLGKYQFFKSDKWRLAFTTGVRLPTGEVDDPDILQDIPFGDGQTDLLFRLYTDYIGIQKVLLNATIRYDLQLPDEEELRVPEDVNLPLTVNKETVDRDLGDIIEFEVVGSYFFTKQLSAGLKYRYTKKFKDSVDGKKDFVYSALEEETDFTGHMVFVSLGYSTIQKYLDKKFPVPFYVNLEYRNRFAGTNNVTKSQYISLNLGVFF